MSLIDLPFAAGDLLRRISEEASPATPHHIPTERSGDRRNVQRLLALGFVALVETERGNAYHVTPHGVRWLDLVGVAEPDAPIAIPAAIAISDDLHASASALLVELQQDPALSKTTLSDVLNGLLRKGLATLALERAGSAPTVSAHAADNVEIRKVAGLLVWSDVAKAIGSHNASSLALSYHVNLLPLPPSNVHEGRPGRAPVHGIDPVELEKLETRYPVAVGTIRAALARPRADADTHANTTDSKAFVVGDVSRPGVYRIRCTVTGSVYVGAAVNVGRRWQQHRSSLRGGSHVCQALQHAWKEHGESAFEWIFVRDVQPPTPALIKGMEQVEFGRAVNDVVAIKNGAMVYNYLHRSTGRTPGWSPQQK